jgi:hypothetical protein
MDSVQYMFDKLSNQMAKAIDDEEWAKLVRTTEGAS